ncbi:MAG TPA: hypothetical protein VH044_12120 [Polyangiaceae bacterium]|jgi:hypothetical protein|nr:hypothetical protein [Polyangiaceae bacterium]
MLDTLTSRITLMAAAAVGFTCVMTGCPGSLEDPGRFSSDAALGACPDVTQTVFLTVCATSQCHSSATKIQSLDLQSPDVASRLVGVAATEGSGLLVDPTSPQSSVLYTKLTSTPPFGVQMPFGQTPLDPATVACVLDWITAQGQGDSGAEGGGDEGAVSDDVSEPPQGDGTVSSGNDSSVSSPADGSTSTPPKDAGSVMEAGHVTHPKDASAVVDSSPPPQEAAAPPGDDADTTD